MMAWVQCCEWADPMANRCLHDGDHSWEADQHVLTDRRPRGARQNSGPVRPQRPPRGIRPGRVR